MNDMLILLAGCMGLAIAGVVSFAACVATSILTGSAHSEWASHSIVAVIFGCIGVAVSSFIVLLQFIGAIT